MALLLLCLLVANPAAAFVLVDADFESGFGTWTHASGDDFDWSRHANGTPSNGTGPSGDHTTGSGWYAYIEASNPNNPDQTAILDGPCIDLNQRTSANWSFWYHMSGSDMGTLHAEVADSCDETPSTWTPVFTVSGDQGTSWLQANVDLASNLGTAFKVRFRGVTGSDYASDIAIDDIVLEANGGPEPAPPPPPPADMLVSALNFEAYKAHILALSSTEGVTGGSRHWSQPGNAAALDYIEDELESYGYTVERHAYIYRYQNQDYVRENVYATKVGTVHPDQMYIVSAHMDSYNTQSSGSVFAPGAGDDGSGTALVLEVARAFGSPSVTTDTSVRFILWNNEETGLNGSAAYVADRAGDQGIESPPGSGLYPEPTWLGIAQHDMMLWDHGVPSGPNQIPGADVDIEFQSSSVHAAAAQTLANYFQGANSTYAPAYPAEVSNNMNHTDSKSFQNECPAISLRENQRVAEIGNGSNPNWHKNSDVYATYSEDDFMLGFTAAQTTTGAIGELAGAQIAATATAPVPAGSPLARWLISLCLAGPATFTLLRRTRAGR